MISCDGLGIIFWPETAGKQKTLKGILLGFLLLWQPLYPDNAGAGSFAPPTLLYLKLMVELRRALPSQPLLPWSTAKQGP
jgi:hypothetical protein